MEYHPEHEKKPQTLVEFLAFLKEKNLPKEEYKEHIDSFWDQKARERGIPLNGHFELTPLCNLDCKMCYVHLTGQQLAGRHILTVDEWKDIIRQAHESGMQNAALSGGECLLYPGFEELYLYLQSFGIETAVLTNGILLDEAKVEFFKKNPPKEIQISLYGCNEDCYEKVTGHRQFERVLTNIKRVRDADLRLKLAIVPSVYMDEYLEETLELCHNLQLRYTINESLFTPREDTGRQIEHTELPFDSYLALLKKKSELDQIPLTPVSKDILPPAGSGKKLTDQKGLHCGAGRNAFCISWDGVMHPCPSFYRIGAAPFQIGFRQAWTEINKWATNYPKIPECEGCPYSKVCSFCPAVIEKLANPGERCEFWCECIRRKVETGIIKYDAEPYTVDIP